MVPSLEQCGMQGLAITIHQALLGLGLCVTSGEIAETARLKHCAKRSVVDVGG